VCIRRWTTPTAFDGPVSPQVIEERANPVRSATTAGTVGFWYSRQSLLMALACLFLLVHTVSGLIPPFQSPDEDAHIARAYLLSKGKLLPEVHEGYTGGAIDTGLLTYMQVFEDFAFNYERKITAKDIRLAQRITWTDKLQFRPLPNTAVYFPLPYLPQAMALAAGERMRWTLQESYYLARFFSLLMTLALLLAAMLLYPAPPAVLVVLLTPMAVFQMGSASLDAVTFGMTALTAALCMRGADLRFKFNSGMHVGLVICAVSLATSRISLIGLTLLPVAIYGVRRRRSYLLSSALCVCLAFAWIAWVLPAVKEFSTHQASTITVAEYYALHPISLFKAFSNTLGNAAVLKSYWEAFVGVLGWLDTPLDADVYFLFAVLILASLLVQVAHSNGSGDYWGTLFLSASAVLALVATFVIELLVWSPYPARLIVGIQGRYFTPILILLGYSLPCRQLSPLSLKWGVAGTFLVLAISIGDMGTKLLHRYWLS